MFRIATPRPAAAQLADHQRRNVGRDRGEGVNLFVACGISGLTIEEVSRRVLPFIATIFVGLLLILFFPQISLFLLSFK